MSLFSSKTSENFTLSAGAIDAISEKVSNHCNSNKVDKKTTSRYRLSCEESLGIWLANSGEGANVYLETNNTLLGRSIRIRCEGPQLNPYNIGSSEDNFGSMKADILTRVALVPEYSYRNGFNILKFKVKGKQLNQVFVLLIVIAISLIVGFLGKLLIPEEALTFITTGIITPIESTFFRILSAIAGPMIFLAVAWGIYGIGDVYTLGRIGKKMMISFLFIVFLFSCFGGLFYPFLGPAVSDSSSSGNQISKVFEMILSIFPSNIFSPFIDGNTLQIIFLAFIIGLSLIFLGQRTSSVARAVEQINYIINFLMTFVSKLVPFFVFIVLVKIIWSGSLTLFSQVWKFALVFICATILANLIFTLYASIRNKVSPLFIIKSNLPSFLITITTASSSASFESNMSICQNKYKVRKELSSFGVPFGMVIFKPISVIYDLLVCFYFAKINGIQTSMSWIVIAIIITAIVAVSTPPIPGGGAAAYSILFLQLGIPAESLAMLLAVDMIFDFVVTSGNINMLLIEIFNISKKLGMNELKS